MRELGRLNGPKRTGLREKLELTGHALRGLKRGDKRVQGHALRSSPIAFSSRSIALYLIGAVFCDAAAPAVPVPIPPRSACP
jgi:hypothetical protein